MQSDPLALWTYHDEENMEHTFWRYKIELSVLEVSQVVAYEIDGVTEQANFHVPASEQNFRWASHSCNGFSSSIDPTEWNGADPLWNDMLAEHKKNPFHIVMGGGDQIYNDKIVQEAEIAPIFSSETNHANKSPLTPEIATAIDRFLFRNYTKWFGSGTFSQAAAYIPMVNMLDDHDLIDGFGTYPDDLMKSPVFNAIGSRGYFFYLLFQMFMNDEVDGVSNEDTSDPNPSPFSSLIIGGPGAYIPFPTHNLLVKLGPKQYMLLLDCRAQRKLTQVCALDTYKRCFRELRALPPTAQHVIIQLGVPLAYPRMVFLENILTSRFNPIIYLIKKLLPSFTNNFNGQVELLDDLNDHWCAAKHKHERNVLIERLQEVALKQKLRITFISGDVHAGGCGYFYTAMNTSPAKDHRYMLAMITSAIVNAPPPGPVLKLINTLAVKKHRSLFSINTRERMLPMFKNNPDGSKQSNKYIIGARNWCAVDYMEDSNELKFDLRVEKSKGSSE
ncbi:hypothetical protein MVES_000698 [Malassezia vespertilionis]|uniref:PhoD-like phosphatase domain-containing protein n=2 Tax=Malassezia vespertilionis TaxID=2020962 RepID=A0A2N1JG34_9BASI|nr:hypothetical protein MVES_000698 [Malassezia vespertilionis]